MTATDSRRQKGTRSVRQQQRGKPPPLQPHLHRTATAVVLDRSTTDGCIGRQPATAMLSAGSFESVADDACQNHPTTLDGRITIHTGGQERAR